MKIYTDAVKKLSQILLVFLVVSCQDLEKALEEELTVSSTNEMYQLELTVSNNVTDINTPIAFEVTVSRLAIETDTVTVVTPEPVTVSEENDLYRLELNLEAGATDVNTPIDFTVDVTRMTEYEVRSDSKVIGIWGLYYMTVDDNVQNVDQFPTDYEIYEDNSFSKIETNTVSGESTYKGGSWQYDALSSTSRELSLTMMGDSQEIDATFDHDGFTIPLDGFMMWNYRSGGKDYYEVLQKVEATDSTLFVESESYLSLSSSGGTIEGYTEPELLDIPINLVNEAGASYEVAATFVPGLDFSEGNILATLLNEDWSAVMNVKSNITITESIVDSSAGTTLSVSSVGGTLEGYTEVELLDISVALPNEVGASYAVAGSFVPGLDYEEGNVLVTLSDPRYSTINLNISISIELPPEG